jgi:hypothetical protein
VVPAQAQGEGKAVISSGTVRYKGKLPNILPFLILSALVALQAALLWDIRGELVPYRAYSLTTVYGGTGCSSILNGEPFHVEGAANLTNLNYFAGGSDTFTLGYEIATNRLLFPWLASLFVPLTSDLVLAARLLNIAAWVLAAWCFFLLGRDVLGSRSLGWILGLLAATSAGFVLTWTGVKGHTLSYAYFFSSIYLLERMNLFRRKPPLGIVLAAGLLLGLGTFANNLFLLLFIYCLVRGLTTTGLVRLALLGFLSVLPLLLLKTGFTIAGIWSADRTDSVLMQHMLGHLGLIWATVTGKEVEPITFIRHTFTDPWLPFRWIPDYLRQFPFICGLPVFLLALCGLPFLRGRALGIFAAALLGAVLPVLVAHTYWPYWNIQTYTTFYASAALLLAAGCGVQAVSRGGSRLVAALTGNNPNWIQPVSIALLLTVMIAPMHARLLSGKMIDYYRFYYVPGFQYPADWDFDIADWQKK